MNQFEFYGKHLRLPGSVKGGVKRPRVTLAERRRIFENIRRWFEANSNTKVVAWW